MASLITEVQKGSPAERAGVTAGMKLLGVNGNRVSDVLDYKFYAYDRDIRLSLEDGEGRPITVRIKKGEGEDIGLTFESYLMDSQKRCSNSCIFCFIDQLPRGMRESLYFKDDDARMSFLAGNYITMTNLSEEDAARIIAMRVSPINISVHTTSPELRSMMLGNRRGGESLALLERFCRAGLHINAQIVVCPGVNDGEELERTLGDLKGMHRSIKSVSVVPVGITRHRRGLFPLRPVDRVAAAEIIRLVDGAGNECLKEYGGRTFFCADELFIKAGMEIPSPAYYEDYPQLENGVGMLALLKDDFTFALETAPPPKGKRSLSLATGLAAAPYIAGLADMLKGKYDDVDCRVLPVKNRLFGESVDVAGLLCGEDIALALEGEKLGDELLLPDCMLRHGTDIFLDDMDVPALGKLLGVKIRMVPPGGEELLSAMLGI